MGGVNLHAPGSAGLAASGKDAHYQAGVAASPQPEACKEPAVWLKRARDRELAKPVCADLLGAGWLKANGLAPLAAQPPLIEQLWLLLLRSAAHSKAARLCLRLVRVQINRAQALQDLH